MISYEAIKARSHSSACKEKGLEDLGKYIDQGIPSDKKTEWIREIIPLFIQQGLQQNDK